MFVLGLPVHMLVLRRLCTPASSDIGRVTDGIAVWVIEKSIKLGVVLVGGSVVGLIYLLGRG